MEEYRPIDLSSWRNAGLAWLASVERVPTPDWPPKADGWPVGIQEFHGIPFVFSEQPDASAFLGFGSGGYQQALTLPMDMHAHWVIFAYRLLETTLREGDPVGRIIGRYVFRLGNGEEVAVPIRERFEIATIPTEWGQWPFLAVPDMADRLIARQEGKWDQLGFRLMEVDMVWPNWHVLWAWKNPRPDVSVESIRIEPMDRPFLISAITISDLQEDPFGRGSCLPAVLEIDTADQRPNVDEWSLDIDRGTSTYLMPLPGTSDRQFLDDEFRGWGQAYDSSMARAYTTIDARPSATVRVRRGEEEILSVRWRDVLDHGRQAGKGGTIELVNGEKNWVHVRVVDDESGEPIACRIHFRSPEGIPYQPYGHHNHLLSDQQTWNIDVGGDVRLGHITYAYVDGTCQGWLPRGDVFVDIARGFEYQPLRTKVSIEREQRELTLRLKRWVNMRESGWFSGDTHVHFLSTIGAMLEGNAEGLDVVNLLQSQWGHYFSNTEDFLGRPVSLPGKDTIVYTSQENRQHVLGHLILLGLRQAVMPWCTGGADEAELSGTLETTLCHWADACREQGGTVIIPHFPVPNCEGAALIATGRADAVEMCWHDMYSHHEYYRYLNGGYRIPLVAGTDKMTAEVPVGINRTYVRIPEEVPFSYESWCQSMHQGRTFITTGPMLRFSVDGAEVGDVVHLAGNGGTIEVVAEATSLLPIHSLELVQEGRVIASVEQPHGSHTLSLKEQVLIDHTTWLAARVGGLPYSNPIHHHDVNHRGVMAHTSPIYFEVESSHELTNRETYQYMLTLLHGGVEHIRHRSRQHLSGTVTHHHGEHDHLAYLERPFKEAIELLNQKLEHQP